MRRGGVLRYDARTRPAALLVDSHAVLPELPTAVLSAPALTTPPSPSIPPPVSVFTKVSSSERARQMYTATLGATSAAIAAAELASKLTVDVHAFINAEADAPRARVPAPGGAPDQHPRARGVRRARHVRRRAGRHQRRLRGDERRRNVLERARTRIIRRGGASDVGRRARVGQGSGPGELGPRLRPRRGHDEANPGGGHRGVQGAVRRGRERVLPGRRTGRLRGRVGGDARRVERRSRPRRAARRVFLLRVRRGGDVPG